MVIFRYLQKASLLSLLRGAWFKALLTWYVGANAAPLVGLTLREFIYLYIYTPAMFSSTTSLTNLVQMQHVFLSSVSLMGYIMSHGAPLLACSAAGDPI